jgi:Tfp pilus assembly protein PilE
VDKKPASKTVFWTLLCVSALIGVLTFVSVFWRNYSTMTLRAKNTEATKNLKEICQAEQNYFREHGVFAKADPTPAREPAKNPTPFDSPNIMDWNVLQWSPDMDVRCQYTIFLTKSDGSDFKAIARCDADGDGDYAQFEMGQECLVVRISDQWVF